MIYGVAQFKHAGTDFVMIPVNPSVEKKTKTEQIALRCKLTEKAQKAGLTGVVVPVWRGYTGSLKFLVEADVKPLVTGVEWPLVARHLKESLRLE